MPTSVFVRDPEQADAKAITKPFAEATGGTAYDARMVVRKQLNSYFGELRVDDGAVDQLTAALGAIGVDHHVAADAPDLAPSTLESFGVDEEGVFRLPTPPTPALGNLEQEMVLLGLGRVHQRSGTGLQQLFLVTRSDQRMWIVDTSQAGGLRAVDALADVGEAAGATFTPELEAFLDDDKDINEFTFSDPEQLASHQRIQALVALGALPAWIGDQAGAPQGTRRLGPPEEPEAEAWEDEEPEPWEPEPEPEPERMELPRAGRLREAPKPTRAPAKARAKADQRPAGPRKQRRAAGAGAGAVVAASAAGSAARARRAPRKAQAGASGTRAARKKTRTALHKKTRSSAGASRSEETPYTYALGLSEQGLSDKRIQLALMQEKGLDSFDALTIVKKLGRRKQAAKRVQSAENRSGGVTAMLGGFALFAVGVGLTAASYANPDAGGQYTIFTGLIGVGALTFLQGLFSAVTGWGS